MASTLSTKAFCVFFFFCCYIRFQKGDTRTNQHTHYFRSVYNTDKTIMTDWSTKEFLSTIAVVCACALTLIPLRVAVSPHKSVCRWPQCRSIAATGATEKSPAVGRKVRDRQRGEEARRVPAGRLTRQASEASRHETRQSAAKSHPGSKPLDMNILLFERLIFKGLKN